MKKFVTNATLEKDFKNYHNTIVKPMLKNISSDINISEEAGEGNVSKSYIFKDGDKELGVIEIPVSTNISIETNENPSEENLFKSYIFKDGELEIGKVNIPKDLFVKSGSIEKKTSSFVIDSTTYDAGTYLKLALVNDKDVFIDVKDLLGEDITTETENINFDTLLA